MLSGIYIPTTLVCVPFFILPSVLSGSIFILVIIWV